MKAKTAFLSLGSNLPYENISSIELLRNAVVALQAHDVQVEASSSLYETPPFPTADQPNFINAVIKVTTNFSAEELLTLCLEVERQYGRERIVRWGARTLDIDILSYDDCVFPDPETWKQQAQNTDTRAVMPRLVLPHPRLHQRDFVLLPMMDIAPEWRHPVMFENIKILRAGIQESSQDGEIRKLNQKLL